MHRWWAGLSILMLLALGAGYGWWRSEVERRPPEDLEVALRAVRSHPTDIAAAWLALGDAQVAAQSPEDAEQAYRTAILHGGAAADGRARARLGFLLYEQGRDGEALRWLGEASDRGAAVPLLQQTLERLAAQPGATPRPSLPAPAAAAEAISDPVVDSAPPGDAGVELDAAVAPVAAAPALPPRPANDDPCEVPVERGAAGSLLVTTGVNGYEVLLIVDTGATSTVLNRSVAERAGVRLSDRWYKVQTANGIIEVQLGSIDAVTLGGRVRVDRPVVICDECIETVADGLLGVDLQGGFDVQVDVAARRLLFADCY